MSVKKIVIEMNPVDYKEKMVVADFKCPTCLGVGGFDVSGYYEKFKEAHNDPNRTLCKRCLGTGRLQGIVSIDWVSYGSIKFNTEEL